MSIKIKNLTKTYGSQVALKDVNLDIHSGEVLGLLGPNGAGKTTLMKSIVGVLKPDHGEIFINEQKVEKEAIATKSLIGYLAENNPLYTDMYVLEYLSFVGDLRKVGKERQKEVVNLVGLTSESHKKIKELSKGYKQRVGLAQAILHDPEILILDEPTNGLDPNQIIEIRQLIKDLSHNKTIILSTHIMQEVEALCNRIVILNEGQKIADTNVQQLASDFTNLEEAFSTLTHEKRYNVHR